MKATIATLTLAVLATLAAPVTAPAASCHPRTYRGCVAQVGRDYAAGKITPAAIRATLDKWFPGPVHRG